MNGRMSLLAVGVFALVGARAGDADAGTVRVVSGASGAMKAQVASGVSTVASRLEVCWVGQRPSTVQVVVTLARDGRVTHAVRKTRHAVAQCAAGVLAVQRLPAPGRNVRVVVELGTAGTASSIQSALQPFVPGLKRCYQTALPAAQRVRGSVNVRLTIEPSGSISAASIGQSSFSAPALHRCLTDAARRMRLARGVVSRRVVYGMRLGFAGGSVSGQTSVTAGGPGLPGGLQPKKKGPLAAAAITRVIKQRLADVTRCYDRVARRKRLKGGHVMLRFTIRGNGTVRNVKVRESTLRNAKVEACIVKVGKTLRFPNEAGRAATKVWYPFSFRAR